MNDTVSDDEIFMHKVIQMYKTLDLNRAFHSNLYKFSQLLEEIERLRHEYVLAHSKFLFRAPRYMQIIYNITHNHTITQYMTQLATTENNKLYVITAVSFVRRLYLNHSRSYYIPVTTLIHKLYKSFNIAEIENSN